MLNNQSLQYVDLEQSDDVIGTSEEEMPSKLATEFQQEDIQREQKHLAAIQEAIEKPGTFSHSIIRGIFVGPAHSGKDALMKHLLREIPPMKSPSTGVAEIVVHIKVNH